MCFIIAGLQPKVHIVDKGPRRCPRCGLYQARMQRVDHYLSLFFIPLFPVKRGEPHLYCERCQGGAGGGEPGPAGRTACSGCGRVLDTDYAYCPHCGRKQ